MLTQSLQQKLQQKLSPQQIQVIKLLEIPTIELEERIKQEIEVNPALEEGDEEHEEVVLEKSQEEEDYNTDENIDFSMGDYREEDDIPDYKLYQQNDTEERQECFSADNSNSLNDYLMEQLHLRNVSEEISNLAEYIIGNIDQDGYVRRNVESLVDDYSFLTGKFVQDEKMQEALDLVRTFEPAGVGSYSLQECLINQLERRASTPTIKHAILILSKGFEDFSQKRYKQLESKTSLSQTEIKEAIEEIVKLTPKPGSAWESGMSSNSMQIIPDFLLENEDGKLILSLNNDSIPPLRVSKNFATMLSEYSNEKNRSKEKRDALLFIKQKMDAAKWFIDAVKQRQETLYRTMEAIIEKQMNFFMDGDETKLKPLILKDIAEMTGYDISTISRVSNSKYIQTEFGIYPLKHFFSESLQNNDGDEVSANEVKAVLESLIKAEAKNDPLTDEKLTSLLNEKGYVVARRTIAKYREQLGYPVARHRKEI